MKNIYRKISFILPVIIGIVFYGCEVTDLNVQDSPNDVSPSGADIDFFLNNIQKGAADFITGIEGSGFDGMSEFGMEATRMLHGFGPSYQELNSPGDFSQIWADAYSSVLVDIKAMNDVAIPAEYYTHIGIGQVIEAYIMMTLVDFFGDVPYSEALQGDQGNFNPVLDPGADIYAAADALLVEAISNFQKQEIALPAIDLYYGGNESQWIKAANTMRLKLHLQTRLVDSGSSTSVINGLISGGNLITDSSDDFEFAYSANAAAPDSRHPFFEKNYGGVGPSSDFIFSNYYMDLLANTYSMPDVRTRYYFYRQASDFSGANPQTKPCNTQPKPDWYGPDDVYCNVPATNGMGGFWGWDHMNSDGIPPHDEFLTNFGVYPAGGPFDADDFRNVSGSAAPSEGLQGAGISPFLLSSYTHFMLAEAALTLGTTGNARAYLEGGMRESIAKTMSFGSAVASAADPAGDYIPTSTDIEDYISEVLAIYDAGNTTDKLRVIVKQYFIALWGNGVEAYNTYRRTGQPDDIQPAVDLADPGVFLRSNLYPSSAADNNSNITQKDNVTTPVFWDTNPANFVD
jgi:hypothetical protein